MIFKRFSRKLAAALNAAIRRSSNDWYDWYEGYKKIEDAKLVFSKLKLLVRPVKTYEEARNLFQEIVTLVSTHLETFEEDQEQ